LLLVGWNRWSRAAMPSIGKSEARRLPGLVGPEPLAGLQPLIAAHGAVGVSGAFLTGASGPIAARRTCATGGAVVPPTAAECAAIPWRNGTGLFAARGVVWLGLETAVLAGAAGALGALPGDRGPRYFAASAHIRLGLLIAACASCGGTPPSVSAL
jgi:hypothetical protein